MGQLAALSILAAQFSRPLQRQLGVTSNSRNSEQVNLMTNSETPITYQTLRTGQGDKGEDSKE